MKYVPIYVLLLLAVFCTASKGQGKADSSKETSKADNNQVITSHGPKTITRNIIQDRKGNIWIAAFDGIFRYDGKSFTNITSNVSSVRFFSLLEDRKGVIWFGVFGGASRYDGKSFRNYIIHGDSMVEDRTGKTFLQRPPYEVTSILEDKTGKLWFATRSNTFVYDGNTFTVFRKRDSKPFTNVRTLIEDRKGAIWLAGSDGLWRYDGRSLTNFILAFTGYVYEDKKGAIWTSSDSDKQGAFGLGVQSIISPKGWLLSRFNEHSLSTTRVPTVIRANEGMLFGILQATDGSIWFGSLNGVHRYDGTTITDFNRNENQK